MSGSFGGTIPVTGLNLGFLGQVSRQGERVIASRPVLSTAAANINFGDPVVIVPTAGGGDSYQQVGDFIAGGGTFTAAKFAGVANREVKTNLAFQTLGNTNATPLIGSYAPNELAEALERGSIVVKCNVGTPASQGPVFVRILANGGIPAGVVGGFEAAADGANTVQLTNVVFRTGVLDGDNCTEITLLNRVAA
jgi:hypothetical protein